MHASIIMTCFRRGDRARIFESCISSLLHSSDYPFDIHLVDNTYDNVGLGAARNAAIQRSTGEYLAIVDDDIAFNRDWLSECIKLLADHKDMKLIATPIHTHIPGHKKFEQPPIDGHRVNLRSGSNCMVMARSSFMDIGPFINVHPAKDGVEFCDRQVRKGYRVVMTKHELAVDLAFRQHSYVNDHT